MSSLTTILLSESIAKHEYVLFFVALCLQRCTSQGRYLNATVVEYIRNVTVYVCIY